MPLCISTSTHTCPHPHCWYHGSQADFRQIDKLGKSALVIARTKGHEDIAAVLEAAEASGFRRQTIVDVVSRNDISNRFVGGLKERQQIGRASMAVSSAPNTPKGDRERRRPIRSTIAVGAGPPLTP